MGWIYFIASWLLVLTIVLGWMLWKFFRAYVRATADNAAYQTEIRLIERQAADKVDALKALFASQVSGLRREIIDIRQRWQVSSWTQEYQERYIEVLEDSHHQHQIPLPPKPRMVRSRPLTEPTIDDQVTDLDALDELELDEDIRKATS